MTGGGEVETGMSSFPFGHSSSLRRVEGLLLGDVHERSSMVEVQDPETTFECDRTWRSQSDPSRLTLTRHHGGETTRVNEIGKVQDQRKGIELTFNSR